MGNLLLAHWRPVAAIAAVLIAFAAGRLTTPTPRAVIEKKERVVYQNRVVTVVREVKVATADRQLATRREVTRETRPDGTHVEHEVETTAAVEHTAESTRTDSKRDEAHQVERDREIRVELRPSWRVSALAGADLRSLSFTAAPAFEFGALVEHRLIGPVSIGAWGLSSGRAGVAVSIEF